MNATVNGEEFQLNGTGVADLDSGTSDITFSADPGFPAGFDPVSCPPICNVAVTGLAATADCGEGLRHVVANTLQISPPRMGCIQNSAGHQLLGLEVATTLRLAGGWIHVSNTMTGFSHLPRLDVNLRSEEYLLPNGAGRASGVCHFDILTAEGEVLSGRTSTPYSFDGGTLSAPVRREAVRNEVEWLDDRTVRAVYTSAWAPVRLPALV